MSGGVNPLGNLPLKTDANGYLLVTIAGGAITPDTITLDNANRDTVLARAAAGNFAMYATGVAGATNAFRLMNGTNAGAALEYGELAWVSNFLNIGTVTNGGSARPVRIIAANTQILLSPGGSDKYEFRPGGIVQYAGVAAAGLGVPAIYAAGSVVAQTTVAASIATFTPAADGDFLVSGNVNVTASTTHSFSINCTYTDEGGTARTLVLPVAQLAGSFVASGLITNVTGTGPYEGAAMHIRAKQTTAITVGLSAGTFTSVTYNARAQISQVQ